MVEPRQSAGIQRVGKGTDAGCEEALTVSPLIASAAVALHQRHWHVIHTIYITTSGYGQISRLIRLIFMEKIKIEKYIVGSAILIIIIIT